jgi:hypothetical protein
MAPSRLTMPLDLARMFRRSGRRFADKNMRQKKKRERIPIP